MQQKVLSPFAGKPATWQVVDHNGAPAFRVEPRVLTPVRASAVGLLTKLGGLAAVLYGLVSVASAAKPTFGMLAGAMVAAAFGTVALNRALDSLFRKRVRLMLTADRFSVRTLFGWKHYDRELPHRFALVPHDWTQAEREQQEYEMQQAQLHRKPVRKQRLYGNSFHVSFDYLGQRNDFMTVHGEKEAVAVVSRLKACDDVLDALSRRGQGTPLSPEGEWGDQPGAVPEDA
jgi:hypothetical protein